MLPRLAKSITSGSEPVSRGGVCELLVVGQGRPEPGEGQEMAALSLVSDGRAAVAEELGDRPLDLPAVPSETLAGLDADPGDVRDDAPLAQPGRPIGGVVRRVGAEPVDAGALGPGPGARSTPGRRCRAGGRRTRSAPPRPRWRSPGQPFCGSRALSLRLAARVGLEDRGGRLPALPRGRTVVTPPTGPCRARRAPPPRRRPPRSSAISSWQARQARVQRWLLPFEQE